jgi:tetratricopeptide (TPR) repeat protein
MTDAGPLRHGKAACAARPDRAEAYGELGNLQSELGNLSEARMSLRRAICLDPKPLYFGRLAKAGKFSVGDPLIAQLQAVAESGLSPLDQALADFALAKAYDDVGLYARSFERLTLGNQRVRARIAYDEAAALALIGSIAAAFGEELFADPAVGGDPSRKPVFIVGMPRSGSTLIERILATHPAVASIGESNDFAAARNEALGGLGLPPFPHYAQALDRDAYRRIAARYLARLPDAPRVINKMPGNFAYLGLIARALPNARILYPRRDPMDTCLSCYGEFFQSGHPFAYDLGELGRYWRACDGLMGHWRAVLPAGMLIEVDYQALVTDPESGTRRMLDHLGLPWDPACLDFSRSPGVVRTASIAQIRQPIYRDSIGRWRRYEAELGELRAALDVLDFPVAAEYKEPS